MAVIGDTAASTGQPPGDHALTEMLLKVAEPAVRDAAEDPADTAELMAVLRLDRRALELWASRGLRLAARCRHERSRAQMIRVLGEGSARDKPLFPMRPKEPRRAEKPLPTGKKPMTRR